MGALISICGLDGSGKTTQAQLLNLYFLENNYKSVMLHTKYLEIDKKEVMKKTLDFMKLNKIDFMESILKGIYAAFSFHYLIDTYISKELKENDFVILDRFIETQYCMYKINTITSDYATKILDSVRRADISFFMDVKPEVCSERIKSRNKPILFHESLENLRIAYNFYMENSDYFDFSIINADSKKEDINKNIINKLKELGFIDVSN